MENAPIPSPHKSSSDLMELSEEHLFVFTIQFYLDACLPHSSLQHGETTYLELYQVQFQKLHDTLKDHNESRLYRVK